MLENIIKKAKTIGRNIAAAAAITTAAACGGGGSGPTTPTTPTPPPNITRNYLVQDTDGKLLGTFSDTHTGGQANITPAYLQSKGVQLTGVDPNYFALNEDYQGDLFGKQIANTKNGNLTANYKDNGQSIVTVLKSGIDWTGAFATPGFGIAISGNTQNITIRQMLPGETANRFNIVDGPESPIIEAIDWLKDMYTLPTGKKILQLTYIGKTQAPATIKTGYYPQSFGANGWHGGDFAIVNNNFISQPRFYPVARGFMFLELAEVIGGFDDLYGKNSVETLTVYPGVPSAVAKPILRASALYGLPK